MSESKNEQAERVVGLREGGFIALDIPSELGYICPVCKNAAEKDGNFDERLSWSEYNGFLWCRVCNKDYPTCLCHPDIDNATSVYLSTVTDAVIRGNLSAINRLRAVVIQMEAGKFNWSMQDAINFIKSTFPELED